MKIVRPWVELEKIDGIKIMKNLERAAKHCYRTEGNIKENSYDHFLRNCINAIELLLFRLKARDIAIIVKINLAMKFPLLNLAT